MPATDKRKLLITAALPYANGEIHIGHMVEHLIVDFQNRFQKMRGHDSILICADDTHGTPVMLAARKKGITPEQMIAASREEHVQDFKTFEIEYDYYGSTNSNENRRLVGEIFKSALQGGHIATKSIQQLYCDHDRMFLPDRFVKGTCPKCKTPDQYGDTCDSCGSAYTTIEVIAPQCSLCGSSPVVKQTEHLFFKLENFKGFLKEWVKNHTPSDVANKLEEWLGSEMQDWCISRDAPYFGFEIPGYPGKFFYVWMDAPVGYMAASYEYCQSKGLKWSDYWKDGSSSELYHCIGKDIIYFHTLFWPAMLKTASYRLPTSVWIHGMLTVNGAKMSKSRGTFISAKVFANHLNPIYFRYYLATKLSDGTGDIDWNFDDFTGRVNAELVGKITNIASRSAQMLEKLGGSLTTLSAEGVTLVNSAQKRSETIAKCFDQRQYQKGMNEIREIADEANKYIDTHQPWILIKTDPEQTKMVLTAALNLFRVICVYLKPILPSYVAQVETLFREGPYVWSDSQKTLQNCPLSKFEHLVKRIELSQVESMVKASAPEVAPAVVGKSEATKTQSPAKSEVPEIEITDFSKIDLRVARIAKAEHVEGAEKLIQLTLDLNGTTKNVFAGIKSAYRPEDLVGKLTVVVANLKPRKMKFGISEGMVLAAGPGGKEIFLLSPDAGAKPGDKIQ
jgi:methionyl-tRNA synthetase